MGIVYEAHDTRLDRAVAVKVIRPELVSVHMAERFQREIAMAARLNHPHIVQVYDSGVEGHTLFFVMQLLEGESLRERLARTGPMPMADVQRLADELVSALDYAHRRGVVHRDVKPENILLTAGGAMLADFGIARSPADVASGLTTSGSMMGTPTYSSPEQLKNAAAVGAPSDQYSLACVLFETLVGRPPFVATNAADLVVAHTTTPPPDVRALRAEASEAMEASLLRAMAKAPESRFATVADFASAFRSGVVSADWAPQRPARSRTWVAVAALALIAVPTLLYVSGALDPILRPRALPAIAVLPCKNNSGDPSQDYFSDGVAEQVITQLSLLPELSVINIQSALRFRDSDRPAREIGRALGADYLVQCSTIRQPEQVLITAHLVQVRDERTLWSRAYADSSAEIIRPQLEAAADIAEALGSYVSPRGRRQLGDLGTANDSAFAAFLRGRSAWNRGTAEGLLSSLGHLTLAVQQDPQFALAFAALADARLSLVGRWMAPPAANYAEAQRAIDLALAAKPGLAEAMAARGRLMHRRDWAWDRATEQLRRARRTSPSLWQPQLDHAKLESALGRHESAVRLAETSLSLDPMNGLNVLGYAEILYFARRFDDALKQVDRAIELEETFAFNHLWRAMILLGLGRAEDAVVAAREATRLAERHPGTLAILARAEAEAGRPGVARALLREMDGAAEMNYVPPTLVAVVHMGLRDHNSAFDAFERALEERDWFISELAVHPLADQVRGDARLQPLLRRMGLERVRPPAPSSRNAPSQ